MIRHILSQQDMGRIQEGLDKAANLVKTTLGAAGRTVILKTAGWNPTQGTHERRATVTKDGISVLRQIKIFEDVVQNLGVEFLQQASEKTMQEAGDGTTTTCVLMQAIISQAYKAISEGANPLQVKKGIDIAVKEVIGILKSASTEVKEGSDDLLHIATVSANNDGEIGKLIADAFQKMGKDGLIDIERSTTGNTYMELSEGIKFQKGAASPYFLIDTKKDQLVLEHPHILLYDKKLYRFDVVKNIFAKAVGSNRPLLVICDGADGESLAAFVQNNATNTYRCCIVSCPDQGMYKKESMNDLSVLTGATYFIDETGRAIARAELSDLGEAEKVIVGRDYCNIISPIRKGGDAKLTDLTNNLRMDLTKSSGEEKAHIEKRIASLTGGVAILKVGAPTEIELGEKRDRCDDAVRAVRAAIAEGYVPGGGSAFLRIKMTGDVDASTDGEQTGRAIVYSAIREPFRQICINAGLEEKQIDERMRIIEHSNKYAAGYNVLTKSIEDIVAAGIIDPTKALRVALENAASAAGTLITSGGGLADQL